MFRLIFCSILVCSCLSACTSWLDQEPVDTLLTEEAFQTPDDLEAALTGVYHLVKGEDLAGRNWLLFADLMGGNAVFPSGDFKEFSDLQISVYNPRVEALWSTSYQAINQLNQILGSIDKAGLAYPGFSEEQQRQMEGEALFLRGLIYYMLVQYFASPYSIETANAPGVPLMIDPVLEVGEISFPARASLQAVYDQVWVDLENATPLLSTGPTYGIPGQLTAKALMTRTAFQQQDYETAGQLAEEVTGGWSKLTDNPQDVFREEGSSEEIWFPVASASNPNFAGLNWAYGEALVSTNLVENGYQQLLTPSQQLALQQEGYLAIDLRGPSTLMNGDPLLSENYQYCLKYEDPELGDDAPVFRLAEFMLIQAETATRSGEYEQGVALLNQVRRRSFRVVDSLGNQIPNAGFYVEFDAAQLSEAEILEAIARERRVELAFEGHYFFDLLRRREEVAPGINWDNPRAALANSATRNRYQPQSGTK
jgi:hypothetical protein